MGRATAEGAIEQANCNSICVYIYVYVCVCLRVGVPFSQFDDSNSSKFHVCVCGSFLASACVTVAKSSREAADECVSLCVCVSICVCVCVCALNCCLALVLMCESGICCTAKGLRESINKCVPHKDESFRLL